MNEQDRDGWRKPSENAHPDDPRRESGRSRPSKSKRSRTSSAGRGRLLLLLLCLFVLGAVLWKQRSAPGLAAGSNSGQTAGILQRLNPACADPFPVAGATTANPNWRTGASARSSTQFINQTPVDRMVDLMSGEQVLINVALPANQTSAIAVPLGTYAWRLRHGAAWCAATGKFVREQRTIITNGLDIVASSTLTVHIEPDAQHPSGFSLRTSDQPVVSGTPVVAAPETARTLAGGGLFIPKAADGHYYLDGMIEDQRVQFMVDTGATGVAIPAELARQLGYYQGPEVTSNTANGQAVGYAIRVKRLTFGPFAAEDVRVAALPALPVPLLGMSMLQTLEIRQTAAGMELRPAR